jgi:hypothetical protein
MSDINISENKELELELLKQQSEENLAKNQLGLIIPGTATTEEKPLWEAYFNTLFYAFQFGIITKEDVPYFMENFAKTDPNKQKEVNSQLFDYFENKIVQNYAVREIVEIDEANRFIDEISGALTPELRERFNYFMNTGEELPENYQQQIAAELAQKNEAEVYSRLQNALNKDKTLNIGIRDARATRGMSADEVVSKFGLDDESAGPSEADIRAKQIQTQSLYQKIQDTGVLTHSQPAQSQPQAPSHTHPRGLDDLLGK